MPVLLVLLFTAVLVTGCDSDSDPTACDEGVLCDGACVDVASDPDHCGRCGARCDDGEVCSEGACAQACAPGLRNCGGACVDTQTDASHCGACGVACSEGRECVDGACACPAGTAECGGACVDTASDPEHCGRCGLRCGEGQTCADGACVPLCSEEETLCDGRCVDTDSDDQNCGRCGQVCPGVTSCAGGACLCPSGFPPCGGLCVDFDTDPAHCGGCNAACEIGPGAVGVACVDGACVPTCVEGRGDCDGDDGNGCETELDADPEHCGACGNACGPDQVCEAGVCCEVDALVCDGVCADPMTDPAHCGGCGRSCLDRPQSEGGSCVAGTCVFACSIGFGDCNGVAEDGCEADFGTDRQNCGGCGIACGALCGSGACLEVQALPSGSYAHSCALLEDGSVHCWGYNQQYQIGDGTTQPRTTPFRVPVGPAVELATGFTHSCVRTGEGTVQCWGKNDRGQLGNGSTSQPTAPVTVLDGTTPLLGATQLALTDSSTCALLSSGRVKCWGSGANGRLGDGTTVDRLTPAFVTVGGAPLENVVEIAAGAGHVCARLAGGTLRCWGSNDYGQLGIGANEPQDGEGNVVEIPESAEPVAVPGLTGVDEIAAAGFRTCARIGGAVQCWGQNLLGQVGDGTKEERRSPVAVVGLTDAISLHLGQNHAFARRADGTTVGWGLGYSGQFHDGGAPGFRLTPVVLLDPGGVDPWVGVKEVLAGGNSYTCVVDADDVIWCWGLNSFGELGDGTSGGSRTKPEPVAW